MKWGMRIRRGCGSSLCQSIIRINATGFTLHDKGLAREG